MVPPPPLPPPPRPPSLPQPTPKPLPSPAPAVPARGPVIPTAQPKAPQQPYSTELRTMAGDIANVTTGRPPQGSPAPTVFGTPITPPPPTVVPLPARSKNLQPIIIIGGLVGIILIGILWLTSGGSEGEIVLSPTPRVTATPTPTPTLPARMLRDYFGNALESIDLSGDSTAKGLFLSRAAQVKPGLKQAIRVDAQQVGQPIAPSTFLAIVASNPPTALQAVLGSDWTTLVYGQAEQFDTAGVRTEAPTPTNRIIFIAELRDASGANQAMQSWEGAGLAASLSGLLGYDIAKASVPTFSTATHKQLPVRYQNFPYPDHTLDHGVVLATNGKGYLVIGGSREAVFFAIDRLLQ